MTVDLNIDPVYIIDLIHWHFDMPFRDAIDEIVKEYKSARNLRPVKIVVLGPPASGKTRVSRYLADHYGIHYVHVKTLISDTIQRLVRIRLWNLNLLTVNPYCPVITVGDKISNCNYKIDDIRAARSNGEQRDDLEDMAEDDNDKEDQEKAREEEEEQDEKEVVASTMELQEQLDEIQANLATNNGRLDDVVLNKLSRYLYVSTCRGYERAIRVTLRVRIWYCLIENIAHDSFPALSLPLFVIWSVLYLHRKRKRWYGFKYDFDLTLCHLWQIGCSEATFGCDFLELFPKWPMNHTALAQSNITDFLFLCVWILFLIM